MNTELIWQTRSTGSDDTERLGEVFGRLLKPPVTVELLADLGGGKTTFVKGLALGFGSKDTVSSPSFTLSKIYKEEGGKAIHHFDFYRLGEAGILEEQLAESVADASVVTVIEWSDIVKGVLPKDHFTIEIKPVEASADERDIVFKYPETLAGAIKKLESEWYEVRP